MVALAFDEAQRRWLVSPEGLLAACLEAVAEGDAAFFDEVTSSSLLGRLDDESLRSAGPPPSARAIALVSAGRLASWCRGIHAEPLVLLQWLELAVAGFSSTPPPSGPGSPRWSAPPRILDAVDPTIREPRARARALLDAVALGPADHSLLAVRDLLHHFLGASGAPATTASTTVLILTSRHRQGELVHLAVMERDGPPGISLDPLAGPFTRAGPAFVTAMETAWRASRPPTSSARWAVTSERTGAAVEVIDGRSVGAGAAVALRYLGRSDLPPLDPSWALTGAVDTAGALGSLLDHDRDLTTYRTKLEAARDRAVVVPRSDHPYLVSLVESGNLPARLVPAGTVEEVVDAARRELAGRHAYRRAVERRRSRMPRVIATVVGLVVLVGVSIATLKLGPFAPGPVVNPEPGTTLAAPPNTSFVETFTNRSGGWPDNQDDYRYDDTGGYRLRVQGRSNYLAVGPRDRGQPVLTALAVDGARVRVDVDAKLVPTANDGAGMGLYCRRATGQSGRYQAVIFPNGTWLIVRNLDPPSPDVVLARGRAAVPVVGDLYHLRLECAGGGKPVTIRLEVGGVFIGEGTDPDGLRGGGVGVVTATSSASGAEVLFDNFTATRL